MTNSYKYLIMINKNLYTKNLLYAITNLAKVNDGIVSDRNDSSRVIDIFFLDKSKGQAFYDWIPGGNK